jgi:hypothetical protein
MFWICIPIKGKVHIRLTVAYLKSLKITEQETVLTLVLHTCKLAEEVMLLTCIRETMDSKFKPQTERLGWGVL